MEGSSPLAAMHRPTAAPWSKTDIFCPPVRPHFVVGGAGAGTISLKNLHKPNAADFFGVDVRGSSPAASLAADLSQNFRLDSDSSPRFPTPRRALFTTNIMTAMGPREPLLTPPLPSSSPGPMDDSMDMSPLPHKMPFVSQTELASPTPEQTPQMEEDEDSMLLDSPLPISRQTSGESLRQMTLSRQTSVEPLRPRSLSRQTSLEPIRPALAERRKSIRRPSLTRAKGWSTSIVPGHSSTGNQLPAFRFGGGCDNSRLREMSSAMSLGECFEAGSPPPQERRPQTANSPPAPPPAAAAMRPRAQFASISGAAGRNGSPMGGHVRRPSNGFRPRKQFRRSLSMFENPGDLMKPRACSNPEESAAAPNVLQAVMDIPEVHEPMLPHFACADPTDSIPRITRQTMVDVLDGKYDDHFGRKLVIDCRFEYEYEGGHIDGAVNHNDKERLGRHLFEETACPADTPSSWTPALVTPTCAASALSASAYPFTAPPLAPGRGTTTLLIFHCEYSAHRAPLMARHVRALDRAANAEHYPRLTYPEVYILEGGYSGFFAEHRMRCHPQSYVEMSDEKHTRTCERELGRLKNGGRRGLGRAQTFHFGAAGVEDSPTAPGRPSACDDLRITSNPVDMVGNSPILGERNPARRMASY